LRLFFFYNSQCTSEVLVALMDSLSVKKKAGSFLETEYLSRFYSALEQLESSIGRKRRLSHCDGRMYWPKHGVYFFFENSEFRSDSGNGPRVVRVGTHALTSSSKTTLWNRLSQHRGSVKTGRGNHRGSIFRLLIGEALMGRYPEWTVNTWGKGSSAPSPEAIVAEKELEWQVSRVIGEMPFLWLEVDDSPGRQSRRGYIERNTIALLSSYSENAVDQPSENWLGNHSPREKVKLSGLWNQRHVEEDCDSGFLAEFESLVARQVAKGELL